VIAIPGMRGPRLGQGDPAGVSVELVQAKISAAVIAVTVGVCVMRSRAQTV
jgi:hypothetical protein